MATKKTARLPSQSFPNVQPRRSLHGNRGGGLKWDMPNTSSGDWRGPGTKPVADPMSLSQLAVVLLLHACRKILITITPERKVAFYALLLTIGSVVCDFMPLPQTYMSHKGNLLNVVFAKWSWLWTLLVTGSFVGITSYIYCCGDRDKVKRHLSRLAVGTLMWYCCTSSFGWIESMTGLCVGPNMEIRQGLDRAACLRKPGYRWRGFDISGHTFLLIYCNLLIHEEARAMRGFERIRDLIRQHETDEDSPLKTLTITELEHLRVNYERLSAYVKGSFVSVTLMALLWDIILFGTVIYFHTLAQKVAGGAVAVAAWYVTYRVAYQLDLSPGMPGKGPFKYAEGRPLPLIPAAECRRRSLVGLAAVGPVRFQRAGANDVQVQQQPESTGLLIDKSA